MFPFLLSPPSLKQRLDKAFKRSKLYFDLGKAIDKPDFISLNRFNGGFKASYKLPIGLSYVHVDKALDALQTAFNAEIDYHLEGRILNMTFYTGKIPESINFNDSFLTRGEFAPVLNMGISRRGMESIHFDKVASPMMMFAGSTGSGKTTAIKSVTVQGLAQGHRVMMGDPKLDYQVFQPHLLPGDYGTEPDCIIDIIKEAAEEVKKRQKWITACGNENIVQYNQTHDQKMEYIFVIVDEVLDFPTDMEMFWEPMAHIARKGRSAGVYCLLSVQRASADMFPKIIRNNIAIRLCLRMEDESDSKLVLGNEAANKLLPIPGRAILRQDSQRELQVPYISKEQVQAVLYGLKGENN